MPRFSTSLRALFVSSALFVPVLAGCPNGDVGAPCNHGRIRPPESQLVTFPALSCNDLLCVYADDSEPPDASCTPGPQGDTQCNQVDPMANKFECVALESGGGNNGECRLRNEYVLERSMCSKKCNSDDDCKNTSLTDRPVADGSECSSGFTCTRLQALGSFCCEKICVCRDNFNAASVVELNSACEAGMQTGCCDQDPVPEACGPS